MITDYLQTLMANPATLWLVLFTAVIAIFLFPFLIIFGMLPVAVAAHQPVSGRISLRLGPSFRRSDRFSGFVDDITSTSFVILEFPASAYEQMKSLGENPAALAAQGVTNVEQRQLKERAGDYVYLTGAQKTALVEYAKFFLIFRERGVAAMITVNVPQAALDMHTITVADIEYALTSAAVMEEADIAPAPFYLSYLGPFEEDFALTGSTRGYRVKRRNGADGHNGGPLPRPYFLIASSMHKLPAKEIEAEARKAFQSIEMFRSPVEMSVNSVRIAGRRAVEITGEAVDPRSGEMAGLYLVHVARHRGGYFRLAGYCAKAEIDAYLPEFRKIANSFVPGG